MKISQTKRGVALIEATLYKRQPWFAAGVVTKDEILLKKGTTQFLDSLVIIDFQENIIKIDGHRQRMRKETSTDLMNIVRLKLTKKLKNVQSS